MADDNVQLGQNVQELLALFQKDRSLRELAEGFDSLQELEEFARLAEFHYYDLAGYQVFKQGERGDSFAIVITGQLRAVDMRDPEQPRLLHYMTSGSIVGARSLLTDKIRAATVETVTPAKIAMFTEDDWYWLLSKNPRARALFESIENHRIQQAAVDFSGRQRDEVVIIAVKRHFVAFLARLPLPVTLLIAPVIFFLAAELFGLSFGSIVLTTLPLIATLPFIIVALLLIAYHYFDWRNDDLIVTTKRVIHIERILFYGEQRRDAPLARVEDVFTISDIFDYFFDSDSLIITTAGVGKIEIYHIRRATEVREAILEYAKYAKERVAEANLTQLQRNIASLMGTPNVLPKNIMAVAEPEWNPEASPKQFTSHHSALVDYFIPRVKEVDKIGPDSTVVTWRKHRFVLLANIFWPTLLLIFLIYLLLIVAMIPLFQILVAIAILGTFFWYVWAYDDWYRDLYQVTDTQIIDIDSAAFRLRKTRRDASFDKIQNVYTETPNLFYKLLNMGNVVIETAGSEGKFTFSKVYDPTSVNQEIFNRLAMFQQKEREKTQQTTNREVMNILREYHRLNSKTQNTNNRP